MKTSQLQRRGLGILTMRFTLFMNFTVIALMSFATVSFVGQIAVAENSLPLQAPQPKIISPNPGEVLRPFNGKDLTGFTRWLQGIGTEDLSNVYSVVDGVLRISGEGMGYLATVDCYKNYRTTRQPLDVI